MFSKKFLDRIRPKQVEKKFSPFDGIDISEAFRNKNIKTDRRRHDSTNFEYTRYRSMTEDKQLSLDEHNKLRKQIDEILSKNRRLRDGQEA